MLFTLSLAYKFNSLYFLRIINELWAFGYKFLCRLIYIKLFLCVFTWVAYHVSFHPCGGQRITFWTQFSPSIESQGSNLGLQAQWQALLHSCPAGPLWVWFLSSEWWVILLSPSTKIFILLIMFLNYRMSTDSFFKKIIFILYWKWYKLM